MRWRAIVELDTNVEAPCWTDAASVDRLPANEIVSMANGLLHIPTRTRFILVEVLDTVAPVDALTDIPRQYVRDGRLGRPAQVYWLCVPLQNRTYRRVARADLESAISIVDAMSEAIHRHDYVEIEDAFDTMVVRAAIALCNLLKLWKARN